jgi:putative transposase
MLRAYKYRIYPTKEQEKKIVQHIGGCRFVYNWALENKLKFYETSKEKLSAYDLNYMLKGLKADNPWLKEVNSQSLQQTNKNMESAFTRFFREKKGFPKFKSKKNPVQSFQIPQHYTVNFEKGLIKLPKIGYVKIVISRTFEGTPKTATISKTPTGKYFISILVDDGKEVPEKLPFNESSTIGVDLGIKDSAILSNGEKFENPKFLKNSLKKLKVLSRRLSKKVKGSNNCKKAKLKLSRLHEKITNQRNDFHHKLSKKLVCENQAIALETLNVCGMIKNHCLAQSIADAGWSGFVEKLTYKAEWFKKTILKIGRFEPSSKVCSICGYYKSDLTLKDREWICPDCKTLHDRDVNAAINIKKFALQSQNLISP